MKSKVTTARTFEFATKARELTEQNGYFTSNQVNQFGSHMHLIRAAIESNLITREGRARLIWNPSEVTERQALAIFKKYRSLQSKWHRKPVKKPRIGHKPVTVIERMGALELQVKQLSQMVDTLVDVIGVRS